MLTMRNTNDNPKTLLEAVKFFSDFEHCRKFMVEARWPDGVVRCPRCNATHLAYLQNARVWKCYGKHECLKFSLKVGTIFEDSPIPLEKWLPTVWLLANCKNGISSYEVGRALGVTQKTAWFMLHRIRKAMQHGGSLLKLTAKWKLMKLSSAARRGTCTWRSVSAASLELEARTKPPSWDSRSVGARFAR